MIITAQCINEYRHPQVIENQSKITGIASGLPSGTDGRVEVRVGGAEWKEANDDSKDGDWTSWSLELEPHNHSAILRFLPDYTLMMITSRLLMLEELF